MQNNLCPQCQSPIPADAPGGICPMCALLGVANPTSPTQAAAASVPTLDEVSAAFPELEVLEMCGHGGMGVVFKARQPKLDRFVALKILTPALATQPGFAERFTREARALAKLSHPHIVGVHDFGESGGFFYLLMEFVDGVNLRQAMRAGVTPEQALLLVPKVCEALQFAHDHGVLHRDIKPENILLDTRGVPKLADFGIAKFVGESATSVSPVNTAGTAVPLSGLTQSGAQLGTAAYMAPEQIEQPATVDHRADIYSLGVVLYEMLTGELPLGRFAAPSEKSHCSSGVDDVVLRALEKQRERRQQSATEMKTQVEGAGSAPPSVPPSFAAYPQAAISASFLAVSGLLFAKIYGRDSSIFVNVLLFAPFLLPAIFVSIAVARRNATAPAKTATNWPRRVFWLIVAIIIIPIALLVGVAIPMYQAAQSRETPPIVAPTISFINTMPDIPAPSVESMKILAKAPFSTVMDFTMEIRGPRNAFADINAARLDFLAAQRIRSNKLPTDGLEFAAHWQTSTDEGKLHIGSYYSPAPGYKTNYDPKTDGANFIHPPTLRNSISFDQWPGYRWAKHPKRQRSWPFPLPAEIPFVLGTAPGKPDVEFIIKATARPLNPDEHADELVIYAGTQRKQLRTDNQRAWSYPPYNELYAKQAASEKELRALEASTTEFEKTNADNPAAITERRKKVATLKRKREIERDHAGGVFWALALPAENESFTNETPELQALKLRIVELVHELNQLPVAEEKANGITQWNTPPESAAKAKELMDEIKEAEAERDAMIRKLNPAPIIEKP